MIVRCFKDTFTFRLDDVHCCVWESPDIDNTLKQTKLPPGWAGLYHDEQRGTRS